MKTVVFFSSSPHHVLPFLFFSFLSISSSQGGDGTEFDGRQEGGREGENRRLEALVDGELVTLVSVFVVLDIAVRRRRQDLVLELQQLAHEAEVWRDDGAPLPHSVKRLLQAQTLRLHQVRHADGGRARDTRLAVHQHFSTFSLHLVWKGKEKQEHFRYVLFFKKNKTKKTINCLLSMYQKSVCDDLGC